MLTGTMLDIYVQMRTAELLRGPEQAPPARRAATPWRRRLGRALVRLGACLEGDAPAGAGPAERPQRLSGSNA
jgi:hypothetical protein